jgi:hypothetical protein
MNFYYFNTHVEDVEELYANHFYGGLFIYDVTKGESFTKIARVIDSDKEFKYLVAARPYVMSPQFLCLLYNSLNEMSPGRIQINLVSGSGLTQQAIKQTRREYIDGDKKDFSGIMGDVTDVSSNIDRSNYLIDFLDMLNGLDTKLPDFFVSTTNRYVFNAASSHNNKMIIPYAMYKSKAFELDNKKIMVSIRPKLRETEEELDALPKPDGIWNKYLEQDDRKEYDYFTYKEFAEVVDQLKNENIENILLTAGGIEQIYSPPIEERKNIISFVKQYKEGLFKG